MADIFTEVEEDLRREKAKAIWARYGTYFVVVAVIAILAVGGHTWWRSYERSQQLEMADRYRAALAAPQDAASQESTMADVAANLEALAGEADGGYHLISLMRAASLYGQAGDHAAASQIYAQIAQDEAVDDLYRDLADILGAGQAAQASDADPGALLEALSPHLQAGSAWRFTALEVAAGLALQAGDAEQARTHLRTIADSPEAPQRASARAGEILRAVGE